MNLNATLIIEVVSFLILLGLLVKFFYRPVLGLLDKRASQIQQARTKIEEDLSSAEKMHQQAQQLLEESKHKALKIKESINLGAEQARQKIIAQAQDEAKKILRSSQQEIINETKKAKGRIKNEIANLSLQAAEKILLRKISPGDQKRLIKELIKEIDSGRKTSGR